LLSGCADTVYKTKLEVYCPPMEQYSSSWNSDLADQVEALGPESSLIPMTIADYAKLRDRIRACEKEKGEL
jgi:hypothetical protein